MGLSERDAWILLVNATIHRADASCERDPLTAMESAIKDKDQAMTALRAHGVDVDALIVDKHGLWPQRKR